MSDAVPKPKAPPKRKLGKPAGQRPRLLDREVKPQAETYYDEASGGFFIRASDGEFIRYSESALRNRLAIDGYSGERATGLPSQIDEELEKLRDGHYVRYAGPLAGYQAGRYDIAGTKLLVTQSPIIPDATYGDNSFCRDYVERLLGKEQAEFFHGWMKLGRIALLDGSLRRGQVFVIAGERNHGKSLLCQLVVIPALGGRHAEPAQGMSGATSFNKDWFGAEVLVMDDTGSDDDYRTRKHFRDAIKQMVGNQAPRCHGKGKDALILTPFWRMIVLLNDELEDLQVLPPMNKSMGDKITMVKTIGRAARLEGYDADAYRTYAEKFETGLGDYLGWLERWTIPERLLIGKEDPDEAKRFGMIAWQHPEIMDALRVFSPEEKLMQLINEVVMEGVEVPMIYTARQVERLLLDQSSEVFHDAVRLLKSTGATGKYLARLSVTHQTRVVEAGRSNGSVMRYKIFPENAPAAKTGPTRRGGRK